MTPEEIANQREFLSENRMYREGRKTLSGRCPTTTKACHGCGVQKDEHKRAYWSRPADTVCRECRDLLNEALDAREAATSQGERKLYFMEKRGYYEGHHASGHWIDAPDREDLIAAMRREQYPVSPSDVIEEAFFRLAESMAAGLPDADAPLFGSVLEEDKRCSAHRIGSKMWLHPDQAKWIRILDAAIREALKERSEAGVEHGRNLIAQLATGELSVQKYNDLTTGKEKR